MKIVQARSFFWSVFSRIRTEYGPENSVFGHFSNSVSNILSKDFSKYLAHFMLLVSFYTSWKYQKISGFLMFTGGLVKNKWYEVGWKRFEKLNINYKLYKFVTNYMFYYKLYMTSYIKIFASNNYLVNWHGL